MFHAYVPHSQSTIDIIIRSRLRRIPQSQKHRCNLSGSVSWSLPSLSVDDCSAVKVTQTFSSSKLALQKNHRCIHKDCFRDTIPSDF